ncbi:hypothetical protein [Aneurinibacillus uraniidurans]|uniref:hypothetical protein n=1 Tax=Aneurinibacillus uraniidurans TaxID=2966586 RepID=UPI00234A9CCA|nr:hypothetical protein [Aneurinibacillus sp. B1]WCN36591.1 hypothetical protein PO771_11980 [Aneurinibacillus sp. B1]
MTLKKKLSIVQMIIAVVVVAMATINIISSPEHNYIPNELLQLFLGLSMTIQGIMLMIKKGEKWLIALSFVAAAFCFYVSLTTFFT